MRRRRWAVAAIVVIVVVGAVAAWRAEQGRRTATGAGDESETIATVAVRRMNLTATDLVNGTLGWSSAPPIVNRRPGTWTSLPAPGQIITAGQALAAVDGRPIILLTGDTPAWRPIGPTTSDGTDVAQLEANLAQLGFDPAGRLRVDGHFTVDTAAAIDRLQRALGETETGTVADGDILFEPAAVRVGAVHAPLGGPAQPGESPFDVTGTTRIVTVELDPGRQRAITPGEPVTVDLLDGTTTPGTVLAVSRVASTADTGSESRATPMVTATVALTDQTAGGDFDQAPVQVRVVTATRTGVLAVPITALVARVQGGYGLEVVDPDRARRIVPVTPGLFTNSLVEVTGAEITDGTTVVTAR